MKPLSVYKPAEFACVHLAPVQVGGRYSKARAVIITAIGKAAALAKALAPQFWEDG